MDGSRGRTAISVVKYEKAFLYRGHYFAKSTKLGSAGYTCTYHLARMADAEALRKQRLKHLDEKRRRIDELRQRKKVGPSLREQTSNFESFVKLVWLFKLTSYVIMSHFGTVSQRPLALILTIYLGLRLGERKLVHRNICNLLFRRLSALSRRQLNQYLYETRWIILNEIDMLP